MTWKEFKDAWKVDIKSESEYKEKNDPNSKSQVKKNNLDEE